MYIEWRTINTGNCRNAKRLSPIRLECASDNGAWPALEQEAMMQCTYGTFVTL